MNKIKLLFTALLLVVLGMATKVIPKAQTNYNDYLEIVAGGGGAYGIKTAAQGSNVNFTFWFYSLNQDGSTNDGNDLYHYYSDETTTSIIKARVNKNAIDYTQHNYLMINNNRFDLGVNDTFITYTKTTTGEYTAGYTRYPRQQIEIKVEHEGTTKTVYTNIIQMNSNGQVTKTNDSGNLRAYFGFDAELGTTKFLGVEEYTLNFSEKQFFSVNSLLSQGKIAFRTVNEGFQNHLILLVSENISTAASPGTYTASFKATYQGVEYTHQMQIHLIDNLPPVITGPDKLTVGTSKSLTADQIVSYYEAFDNELGQEVTVLLYHCGYFGKESLPGDYPATLNASDGKNVVTKNIVISVYDDVAPIITGPSKFIISTGTYFNVNKLKDYYVADDAVDGNIDMKNSFIRTDTFTGNGTKTGMYKIVLGVVDKSGNVGSKEILIEVTSRISNMFIVELGNKVIFNVPNNHKMTDDDVVNGIIAYNPRYSQVSSLQYRLFDMTTYESRYQEIHSFDAVVELSATNGLYEEFRVTINVVDSSWFSGKVEDNSSSGIIGTILVIVLVAVGVVIIVKAAKKKKNRW